MILKTELEMLKVLYYLVENVTLNIRIRTHTHTYIIVKMYTIDKSI